MEKTNGENERGGEGDVVEKERKWRERMENIGSRRDEAETRPRLLT
jgi:hypothetical protein